MAEPIKIYRSPVFTMLQDITETLKSLSIVEVKLQNWFVLRRNELVPCSHKMFFQISVFMRSQSF